MQPTRTPDRNDRKDSVRWLIQVAEPVLVAGAAGQLPARLPSHDWEADRAAFAPLEALGRTLAGIAPWLELGPDATEEGLSRRRCLDLATAAVAHSVDPKSTGYVAFDQGGQPLVDAAFLAHGLLRAPSQLWGRLDATARGNVVAALRRTRAIRPPQCNWLLFSAMVEACLWRFTGECRMEAIEEAVRRHQEWYLGDGTYGDGPALHWDYYNSYVIQPMLLQTLEVCLGMAHPLGAFDATALARARRYAAVQERMISPEGTFPVIGRSSAYRMGAFQLLSDLALRRRLPEGLAPASVRGALTCVTRRMIEAPGTFDAAGWLRVGAVGHQPSLRESYISTGSLYLCLTGLLHLGLPATDPFWTAPAAPWTQQRIWSGEDIAADHAHVEPVGRS